MGFKFRSYDDIDYDAFNRDYGAFLHKLGKINFDGENILTHDGYPLSVKEAKFIDIYVATGSIAKACKESHMSEAMAYRKDYIIDEIKWRIEQLDEQSIADSKEVMRYFTRVMRGEEKDQFGLDAPLSERTAAAREIAKRTIDIENRLEGKEDPVIQIKLVRD